MTAMVASLSGDDDWSLSDESTDLSEYASDVALTNAPLHSRSVTGGARSNKAHLVEAVTKLRISKRVAAQQNPNSKAKETVSMSTPYKRKSPAQLTSGQQSCKKVASRKAHQDVRAGRIWGKECRHNVEVTQLPRKAEKPTARVRSARRTQARKSARNKKAPVLKVVAKVGGKRVLDPRNIFEGTVPTASLSLSSRAGREYFTKRLMQAGWRIEARANKITYWSPARSSISFSSMLQIAKTYPHLLLQ